MKKFLLTVAFLFMTLTTPVFALDPTEVEHDIPSLIERFITNNTKHGAPRSYTWVIEEMAPDSAGQIVVEIRILSASLDRKTVDDDRYRILFAYLEPNPMRKYGYTSIVGYSKLSSATNSCEPEKK